MLVKEQMKEVARKFLQNYNRRKLDKIVRPEKPNYQLWRLQCNDKGNLAIGCCDVVDLCRQYGTPLHIVDKQLLKDNYEEFISAFMDYPAGIEVFYSYKTNPVPGVLKELHRLGAGAEVISHFELWMALQLGVQPEKIIYNGPKKSDASLKLAIDSNIRMININSASEIQRLARIAREREKTVPVGIRINPRFGWSNQFGFSLKGKAIYGALEEIAATPQLNLSGIHVHLGSSLKKVEIYEKAIEEIVALIKKAQSHYGLKLDTLDLGGGFGIATVRAISSREAKNNRLFDVPYRLPAADEVPSMKQFGCRISAKLLNTAARYNIEPPRLILEPGRWMTSNTQILVATVFDIIEGKGVIPFAILDAGINIASMASWEYHEIFAANKLNKYNDRLYRLAGPLCTPSDLLTRSKKLPPLIAGDIIAIMDTGAYFTPFTTTFSFPRPAQVLVDNGNSRIIRRRETFEEIIRFDVDEEPE